MPKGKEEVTVQFEGARIIFRNFSGSKTPFNKEGERNFCLVIPDNLVEQMQADDWLVKFLDARDEEDTVTAYVPVKVGYEFKAPQITLVTSSGRTPLTEDTVALLDFAEIENIDLIIRAHDWNVNDKTGRKAYLKQMFVTIEETDLDRKYGHSPIG